MTTKNATEIVAGAVTSRVFVLQTFDEHAEPRNYLSEDSEGEIWTYATREQAENAKKAFDEALGEDDDSYKPSQIVEETLYQYPA